MSTLFKGLIMVCLGGFKSSQPFEFTNIHIRTLASHQSGALGKKNFFGQISTWKNLNNKIM